MTTHSKILLEAMETAMGSKLEEAAKKSDESDTSELDDLLDQIDVMADYVADEDSEKFFSIVDKYSEKLDSEEDDAEALKMAKALLKELEGLSYVDPEKE